MVNQDGQTFAGSFGAVFKSNADWRGHAGDPYLWDTQGHGHQVPDTRLIVCLSIKEPLSVRFLLLRSILNYATRFVGLGASNISGHSSSLVTWPFSAVSISMALLAGTPFLIQ